MEPAPPKDYPFPCTQCRARFFCHCNVLEKTGWCWTCKILNCSCPKKKCTRCLNECVCDIFEPLYTQPIPLEKPHGSCKKCDSPYECVCDLLVEHGNCPTCMKLVCACATNSATPDNPKSDTLDHKIEPSSL